MFKLAIDICTIFSNIIDNAIEAVSLVEGNKYIDISLRKHNNYLVISEKNPCKNKVTIVDNSIDSTKKDHGNHGFGLVNIKEVVGKYDWDVNLSVNEVDGGYEFSIEIVL